MPILECKPLLDACGPNIYDKNAFRVLGVDVDQKGRQIKRKEQDLQSAFEVGELADEFRNALRPNPLPTREELSQAARELIDAQQRFIHEFFWFWPMEWGKSSSDDGMNLIKAGKVTECRRMWTKLASEDGRMSLIAKHNLAVLGHFLALNREQKILASTGNGNLTDEIRKETNAYWSFAFKYWEPLCEDEAFWAIQAERIRLLDDPRLTPDFLNRFSQTLPIAFDNINADMAVAYCDKTIYTRAKDHVQIMKATNAGSDDVDASLRRVTGPLHSRIDHAIETATFQLANDKLKGKQRCIDLFNTVNSILNVLQVLLGKTSPEFIETSDRVAESMFQCQVTYGNETGDWDGSLRLLELILKVARGNEVQNKIRENIKIVNQNIQTDSCWFCQQNKKHDSSGLSKKMHKKLYMADIATGKYPDLARQLKEQLERAMVQNPYANFATLLEGKVLGTQQVTITIPRCDECKKVHGTGKMISTGAGLVTGICFAILAAFIWDGSTAFFLGLLGFCVGWIIWAILAGVYISSEDVKGEKHWKAHPIAKELFDNGWKEGVPPANTQGEGI